MNYRKTKDNKMYFKESGGCYFIFGVLLFLVSLAGLYFIYLRNDLFKQESLYILLGVLLGFAFFSWKSYIIIDKNNNKIIKNFSVCFFNKKKVWNISDINSIEIIRELRVPTDQDIRSGDSKYHIYSVILQNMNVNISEYSKHKKALEIAEKVKGFLNIEIIDKT